MSHTIKHHVKTAALFKRLEIHNIDHYYNTRLLRWGGHIARMTMQRLPRKLLTSWVPNKRPVGAPQMNFGRTLNKALKSSHISTDFDTWRDLAQYRENWRNLIFHT